MENQTRPFRLAEEINTFCPIRFQIGSRHFDGLLDTVDARGGTFFILTEDEQPHQGTSVRTSIESERSGDLILGNRENCIRVPCRIRGTHIDEDGLYAYLGLDFVLEGDSDKTRLKGFISALW